MDPRQIGANHPHPDVDIHPNDPQGPPNAAPPANVGTLPVGFNFNNYSIITLINEHVPPLPTNQRAFDDLASKFQRLYGLPKPKAYRLASFAWLGNIRFVRDFFKRHEVLRFLDIFSFMETDYGRKYHSDLLVRLTLRSSCIDPSFRLGRIVHQYSENAKDRLLEVLLHCAAFACTTFSFLPELNRHLDATTLEDVASALRVYTSAQWNTTNMPSQEFCSFTDIAHGWQIVSECLKVFMDELLEMTRRERPVSNTSLISVGDIDARLHSIVEVIVLECLSYLFVRIHIRQRPSVNQFVSFIGPIAQQCYDQLLDTLNIRTEQAPILSVDYLRTQISRMSEGVPTMAEIRFSSSTSRADVRILPQLIRRTVNYQQHDVDYRCRITNTAPIVSTYVKDNHMYHWKDDVPVYFPHASRRRHSDRHEIEPLELPSNVQEARGNAIPDWMITGGFEPQHHYSQAMNRSRRDLPFTEENFGSDRADSDFEMQVYNNNELARAGDYAVVEIGQLMEEFYTEICDWIIHPTDRHLNGHINSDPVNNGAWVRWFCRQPSTKILNQATHARDADEYIRHMSSFLFMHIRAQVINELSINDQLEDMKRNPDQFCERAYAHEEGTIFFRMNVSQVTGSKTLYHINAETNVEEDCNELFDSMLGLCLCVGFMQYTVNDRRLGPRTKRTKLFFMVVRSADFVGDDFERMGFDGNIDVLTITASVSKKVMMDQRFLPAANTELFFYPLMTLASEMRMYKAIHHSENLPAELLDVMYGNGNLPINYTASNVLLPVTRSTTTHADAIAALPTGNNNILNLIRTAVDPGSLTYLENCLNNADVTVDASHFNGLLQCMRTIGAGELNSNGMAMIEGPPGTGKTNLIIHLIGALLHHSQYGHVGVQSRNLLGRRDNILRCARSHQAFKILVVASSNAAIDNIVQRIYENGITDGQNGVIRPKMVRIGRYNYNPPDSIRGLVIREAARTYDPDWQGRNNPSLGARRNCADETIIFCSTSSSAGSSQLLELRQDFDIVIVDEGANSLEPEVLIPLTAANKAIGNRRLYTFMVGDSYQLPALSYLPFMIKSARLDHSVPFVPDEVIKSLFERLIKAGRVTHYFLSAQWRMHPSISYTTSVPFYNCFFQNPLPETDFNKIYNQVSQDERALAPMSFIDTATISNRAETSRGQGRFFNEVEALIVGDLIQRLFNIDRVNNTLNNQIAVIAPYREQVGHIERTINHFVHELRDERRRHERGILVCTVDSMQGSQKDVVIFSATRSNAYGNVGFVQDSKRLNVSVTRARYLNIVIGDSSTIKFEGKGIPQLRDVFTKCSRNANGAEVYKPTAASQQSIYQYNLTAVDPVGEIQTRSAAASSSTPVDPEVQEAAPDFDFSTLFINNN